MSDLAAVHLAAPNDRDASAALGGGEHSAPIEGACKFPALPISANCGRFVTEILSHCAIACQDVYGALGQRALL